MNFHRTRDLVEKSWSFGDEVSGEEQIPRLSHKNHVFYFPPKKKLSKQIAPNPKSWPTKNSTRFIISLTVPSNLQQQQQFCPKPIIISASSPSPTHHSNAEAMNTRTPFLNNCSSVTAPHGRFKKQWQCQARGVNCQEFGSGGGGTDAWMCWIRWLFTDSTMVESPWKTTI